VSIATRTDGQTFVSRKPFGSDLKAVYRNRFTEADLDSKRTVWDVLCDSYFSRWIPPTSVVLDVGAGSCEFINAVVAGRKIAVDLNPDTAEHAAANVEVLRVPSTDLAPVSDGSVDVVFTSNFLEHLPDKDALLETLRECRRVLVPGGRLLVLMPNIRYLPGRYWDFLDHHLPLTHVSLVEALHLSGFQADKVVPRLLPYTVKDLPITVPRAAIRAYLRLPLAWRVLGRQMFVAAHSQS
jgi:SAM-dependent methyltransferase